MLKENRAAQINLQPVGTGPYRFKSYTRTMSCAWSPTRLLGWQSGHAGADLLHQPRAQCACAKLLAGECQVSSPLRDVDVSALDGKPGVVLQKIRALNIST